MSKKDHDVTRRNALIGAAAAGALATAAGATSTSQRARLPVAYIPHGGGPWPFVDFGIPWSEWASLADYLKGLAQLPTQRPTALLVVSAHWEAPVPTVMASPQPPMLYDYYGFPDKAYELSWPAAGDPALAARVRSLLDQAGIESASNDQRGFDHGTFIPLMLAYPEADIPTVQLSLRADLDPAAHLALGRALAPLRDEGVFIIGSGMSFHNLRAMRDRSLTAHAPTFDAWLQATIMADPSTRAQRLQDWAEAPAARLAHPREEHLLPLMVVAGAAGDDAGVVGYSGVAMGWKICAAHFG